MVCLTPAARLDNFFANSASIEKYKSKNYWNGQNYQEITTLQQVHNRYTSNCMYQIQVCNGH